MGTIKFLIFFLALQLITAKVNKFTFLGRFLNAPASDLHNDHRVRRSGEQTPTTVQQQSFYFRSQNAAGWATAASDCKAFLGPSATLLYIETQDELANVTHYIRSSDDIGSLYWIGGRYDPDRATFVWDNDAEIESSWAPWEEDQPNTWTPVTRVAAATVGSVKFRTQFSTESTRYICELKSALQNEHDAKLMALPCDKDNDLVILLASTGSEERYKIALEFIARLATAWKSNSQNRVSVVIGFSNEAHVVISLQDAATLSTKQIRENIYRIPYSNGPSSASSIGLNLALREIEESTRTNVPQNLVFLTDGVSHWSTDTITSAAEKIYHAGIKAYSVGIGESVRKEELLAVTGNKTSHVFNVHGSPQDLLTLLKPVSRSVCEE